MHTKKLIKNKKPEVWLLCVTFRKSFHDHDIFQLVLKRTTFMIVEIRHTEAI